MGNYENRVAMIELHEIGMGKTKIFKTLYNRLESAECLCICTFEINNEIFEINDRKKSDLPSTLQTLADIKAVRRGIHRSPLWSKKSCGVK